MTSIHQLVDESLRKDINRTFSVVKNYLRQRLIKSTTNVATAQATPTINTTTTTSTTTETLSPTIPTNLNNQSPSNPTSHTNDDDTVAKKAAAAAAAATLKEDHERVLRELKELETEHLKPGHKYKETFSCEHRDNIPEYLRRDYILYGYRVNYSWVLAFKSMIIPNHNEFANIHSHLWPAVYFIYLLLDVLYIRADTFDYTSKLVLGIFLLSGLTTFTCSVSWHTLGCHNITTWKRLLLCDYMGIIFLIVGSFYPPLYYAFRCHPTLMTGYLTTITVLGVGLACLIFIPSFAHHNRLRTVFFSLTAFFGIVPTMHSLYIFPTAEMGLAFFIRINTMFALFGFGLIFYVGRIPERWFPGVLDNIISSHAMWHLFTFLAPLYHYHTCIQASTLNLTCSALSL
ncbi:hypothetical protein SAMD00019534_013260 [Acytostelium subglobosum LB1]|uniref:hypothetical protein n=1 Tax=Acytostelium subglobosum LB1 TaxID=1410327 RepID=UPI0006448DA9|nr:hypothetical protein SAMD00019534_013260 [Acytostelium subglobosum LB1]GAM18151.1 hypothetical protein SAMD00019534_013260 [Acytostelium subglobosum LB1]|eukprot:XP_012758747.1 hypothetical protein SAMD00019534_013260 [Acytostelium subglobosum LB1]